MSAPDAGKTAVPRGCGCNGQSGGAHIVLSYGGEEYRLPETPDVNRLVYKLATEAFAAREAAA